MMKGFNFRRSERGGATVELTIVTPILILLLLMVVAFGRIGYAREQVQAAARDGARAASMERSAGAARSVGADAAQASLQSDGASCRNPNVSVDVGSFRPGGNVAVDVVCNVDLADLSLLRLPGSKVMHARFVEPLDVYRGASS